MICSRKGYPLKVVMPDNVTEERTQLLRMYGAEIVYSPGEQGSNGAVAMALEMAEADASYYMPYQYGNQANPNAHYNGTAVEILEELDEVTAFVAGLGTGGTLMGNARRFKEHDPDTLVVAAEPLQGELVQGLRSLDDGFIPPIIDLSLLDRKIFVSNRDSVVWTKRLLEEEGLFAGSPAARSPRSPSGWPRSLDEGNVVFVVCDDGWKYLSSGVYTRSSKSSRPTARSSAPPSGSCWSAAVRRPAAAARGSSSGAGSSSLDGLVVEVLVLQLPPVAGVLVLVLVVLFVVVAGALEGLAHLTHAAPDRAATSGSRLGPSTMSASTAMNMSSIGDGERKASCMGSG